MPGRETPVYLTRSPPFDVQPSQLVFYDVVDVRIAARSCVLSTIADAGGEARLPDAVTLSDFKLWISFVEGNHTNLKDISFSALCTVVKVADALDDQDIAQWSHLAAARLVQHARFDPPEISIDSVDSALSTLAEAAQHRIFSAAACAPRRLYSLLSFLPSHYHTSVVAAAITPEKVLGLTYSWESVPTFQVVKALLKPPSSVLSLHLHDPKAGPDAERHGVNLAVHLVQALHHHTHLIGFSVSSKSIDAASAKLLFPAIASLTSLQSLHLGAEECPFPADSMPLLQQTLPSLPRLEDLSVMLSAFPEKGGKRSRMSEEAPPPGPYCLATALSPATALTSLRIYITEESQGSWYSAIDPLTLPHLRQVTVAISTKDWTLTTALINHLYADPLTSLALRLDDRLCGGIELPCSSVAGARRFVDRLSHFSQLRCLTVLLPRYDRPRYRTVDDHVMEMMTAEAPAVLASLAHLQEVSITADLPVLRSTVPALAALTAITCLALHAADVPVSLEDSKKVMWSDICTSLHRMSLKQLSVTATDDTNTRTVGLAALRPLTQLSSLRVGGWYCLSAASDCEGLAGMAALRRLALVDCFDGDDDPAVDAVHAVHTLLALSALTALTAWSVWEKVDKALVDEMRARSAGTVWPALQELSLRLGQPRDVAGEVVSWACGLPALKRLAVSLPHGGWIGDEDDFQGDERRDDEHYEDAELDDFDLGQHCWHIATEAGVELSRLEPYGGFVWV